MNIDWGLDDFLSLQVSRNRLAHYKLPDLQMETDTVNNQGVWTSRPDNEIWSEGVDLFSM